MNKSLAVASVRGIEAGDNRDLILPRVLLIQKMTKLVEEGAVPGTLVNTLTKKKIEDPTFVPVVFSKYFDLYKWTGDKKEYEGRVFNENDPKLEGRRMFKTEEGPATVIPVMSFISLVEGNPMIIPFSKSSLKAGRKLYTFAATSRKDLFEYRYKLVVNKQTNEHGTFYVLDVEQVGETSDDQYALAEQLYNSFHSKISDINSAGPEGEEVPF